MSCSAPPSSATRSRQEHGAGNTESYNIRGVPAAAAAAHDRLCALVPPPGLSFGSRDRQLESPTGARSLPSAALERCVRSVRSQPERANSRAVNS